MSTSTPLIVVIVYKDGNKVLLNDCKVGFNLTKIDHPPIPLQHHQTIKFLPSSFMLQIPDLTDKKNPPTTHDPSEESGKTFYISATLRDSNTNELLFTTIARASIKTSSWQKSMHKITVSG